MFVPYIAANQALAVVARAFFQLGAGTASVVFVYDATDQAPKFVPQAFTVLPHGGRPQPSYHAAEVPFHPHPFPPEANVHAVVSLAEVSAGFENTVSFHTTLYLGLRQVSAMVMLASPRGRQSLCCTSARPRPRSRQSDDFSNFWDRVSDREVATGSGCTLSEFEPSDEQFGSEIIGVESTEGRTRLCL